MQLDFARIDEGRIEFGNEPGRVVAMKEFIMQAKAKGAMDFKDALSIKGTVSYADAQVCGRMAALVKNALSDFAKETAARRIPESLSKALDWMIDRLGRGKLRVIKPITAGRP